ncbi:pyridoxal phosphate-dependent aminotransferase [Planctomycetaceae bacterium AH-315-I19]|nr:pyridoxal phosphate-dependent aminotransferase [Planctomycetaceae bacterium AH-315-I19]
MQTSSRVRSLKPSTTLAVTARAKELRESGVDVVSFAAGEPDFITPKPIIDAAKKALDQGLTHYGPVPGDLETRRLLAHKLENVNNIPNITPDHVVVSSGGKHSLYQLFQTLIDPPAQGEQPQEVIVPTPAWVSYMPQIELAGGRVVQLRTDAAHDFKLTPTMLNDAITRRTRCVLINSPSNPCGTMYTPNELKMLGEVIDNAARTVAPDITVISDELYEHIVYGGIPHFSIGSMESIAERTITVNGLSKAYAMTGWRIGYFAGSGEFGLQVAAGVKKLQSQSTTSIPTFLMPPIRTALTECAADVERMCAAFAERAAMMFDRISAIDGIVCPRPTGAFYLFPDLSAHFGKKTPKGAKIDSALSFATALLDEAHVAVVPGEDFGSGGENCVRLTFACADETITDGCERIAAFIESLS